MFVILFLLIQSALSCDPHHVFIDAEKGVDSIDCFCHNHYRRCQSLEYVAEHLNDTSNVTITITSLSLNLSRIARFTRIHILNLNTWGTTIKCKANREVGIFFANVTNITLYGFTLDSCGFCHSIMVHYNINILKGLQAMYFSFSSGIVLDQVAVINSNGLGILFYESSDYIGVVSCNFSNNIYDHHRIKAFNHKLLNGGGIAFHHRFCMTCAKVKIDVDNCKFTNNSAFNFGGAINIAFLNKIHFQVHVYSCTFINNKVNDSGGAISITFPETAVYKKGYLVILRKCKFINNQAQFGGAMALQIPYYDVVDRPARSRVACYFCFFSGNKAEVGGAVNINGNIQKQHLLFNTAITFGNCKFENNVYLAWPIGHSSVNRSTSIKAVFFAVNVAVRLQNITFSNNIGTALYLVNSIAYFMSYTRSIFINNVGDTGGAIFLSDYSIINAYNYSSVLFSNNHATIGGAISVIQSPTYQFYKSSCFIYKDYGKNLTFINNSASSELGHDIFMSSLESCLEVYNFNQSAIFTNFHFFSNKTARMSTGPTNLTADSQESPYPGLPYTLVMTEWDQLNNIITNLQLFPLSATLLNKTSSVKIVISYAIANNYTIIFKGNIGSKNTLLLQTTEYNAALSINITLSQCPPGYIFHNDMCYCSHSTSFYYYGVLHCIEGKNAVITTGVWAGYEDTFLTADCSTSLCDYHNSQSTSYGEHILPLSYNLLSDHVCAPHRTGVLCGSCIKGYSTYLHSPNYLCGESTHCIYGPLLYIVSEIIPVTAIFLLILFLNINLTSGSVYSFIFFSQIVNNFFNQSHTGVLMYLFNIVKIVYGVFDLDILEINQLSFCLFKNSTIMDLMLIKYMTTLYALFLIIITILVMRFSCYSCVKLCYKCGRRNVRGSVINGLTAFLVLCYFHCLVITLYILVPSYLMGRDGERSKIVPLYSGDSSYMSVSHLKYVIPAIICLVFIIIPPPVILLSEPLLVRLSGALKMKRNPVTSCLHKMRMKLKPFLDSFQGCFSDNCRYFAGLFFLYRILLVLIPVYLLEGTFWNIMARVILISLILLLHCICLPFEKMRHNHLGTLLLINLLMVNVFQLPPLTEFRYASPDFIAIIQLVLISLPLLYCIVYTGYCFLKGKMLSRENNNDDDIFPARLLYASLK